MTSLTVWEQLREQLHTTGPGSVRRRMNPTAPCDVFLALEVPTQMPMLIMTVPSATAEQLRPGTWSLGVRADLVPSSDDSLVDVCLKLSDRRFLDIFGRLCDDIIESVTAQPTAQLALHEFGQRFTRWQRFLERAHPDGLSAGAQMGLFGELLVLREFLLGTLPVARAVEAWVGPLGANQDFQLGLHALEAKTTGTKLPLRVPIQSERQLDLTGLDSLHLIVLVLDVRDGGSGTLPELVGDVRQRVAADANAGHMFEDRLFQMGYFDSDADKYRRSYTVREQRLFNVIDDFPRIAESDLRDGVGDVRYSVALDSCLPFEAPVATAIAAIRGANG